jgi:hypothetical protein
MKPTIFTQGVLAKTGVSTALLTIASVPHPEAHCNRTRRVRL